MTVAEWGKGYEDYLYGQARPPTPPSQGASPSQNVGRSKADPLAGGNDSTILPSSQLRPQTPQQTITTSSTASSPDTPRDPTEEELDEGNFLTMNCYGPYDVEDPGLMGAFIRNLMALMLELSD